ncbi:MAG: MarR family winged helix-turn-helix transcriptional regulator [DPANN group archaeon]|nr:MarR family winged helix-turn-helix transcriptional regulator [DPANN group archaeon]
MKPVQILIALQSNSENYASTVAKIVDCTYSHTMKILEAFHNEGIVSFDKKGRVKFVSLTEKGKNIAKDFEKIINRL